MSEIDFGYEEPINPQEQGGGSENPSALKTNLNPEIKTGEEVTPIDEGKEKPIEEKPIEETKNAKPEENKNSLEVGTVIELGNDKYTVADNGDLLDANGNVFKKSEEVNAWLKEQNVEEPADNISLENIQNIIGIEITDDNDKPITFDNTPQGIADYVNAVIETSKDEIAVETINALYAKYPFLENAINYYSINGNFDGFTDIKDRRSVTLDANNEAQQEAIIRDAWKEDRRRGNVEDYIKFLKSNNNLYDTAKEELEGLKAKDTEYFKSIKDESDRRAKEQADINAKYWGTVKDTIDKRVIGNYKIPEAIIINKDGKRTSATPNDFFNYVYQVNKEGKSRYMKDLEQISPTDRLNDELIRAYITFSGGSFENLVNMVVNEQKVKTIKLKSNNAPTSKVKVTAPTKQVKEIDFGY